MKIAKRGLIALNLNQYNYVNPPEIIRNITDIICPYDRLFILRMLVKSPFTDFLLPKELSWMSKLLDITNDSQLSKGIIHPFCYITIRHGINKSINDVTWHVDGFSKRTTHLPEQNYFWSNCSSTEYINKKIKFPKDFDPFKHNIHKYINSQITGNDVILKTGDNNLYCFDPYVIHRRSEYEGIRTFVRISFTPIEIIDKTNTINPLLSGTIINRDSVKDFRNTLIEY